MPKMENTFIWSRKKETNYTISTTTSRTNATGIIEDLPDELFNGIMTITSTTDNKFLHYGKNANKSIKVYFLANGDQSFNNGDVIITYLKEIS